jgi:2-succinyl-6-hydroxy-2,4-cyclohexadiene-1-carboxylate synthase
MGQHQDWLPIVKSLPSSLFSKAKVHLLDLPGHGEAYIGEKEFTFELLINNLKEYTERKQDQKNIFIGYSMGGRIAFHLADNKTTKGLFIESSSLGIEEVHERTRRLLQDKTLLSKVLNKENGSSFSHFVDNWYNLPIFKGIKDSPNYHAHIAKVLKNDPIELQKAMNTLSVGNHLHFWDILRNYNFPVKFICGKDDEKYSGIGKRLIDNYPLVKVNIVPNCSHNIHLQQTNSYLKELKEFLKEAMNFESF